MSLIVGLGSPHGDDQLGWIAVDRLRSRLPAGISAHKVSGGLELLACLERQDEVIVIDAAAPAGQPGLIRSFKWPCSELASCALLSTHGLGLVEALSLAGALGQLPCRLTIYTIQGQEVSPGSPCSEGIVLRVDTLVEAVLHDLAGTQNGSTPGDGPSPG